MAGKLWADYFCLAWDSLTLDAAHFVVWDPWGSCIALPSWNESPRIQVSQPQSILESSLSYQSARKWTLPRALLLHFIGWTFWVFSQKTLEILSVIRLLTSMWKKVWLYASMCNWVSLKYMKCLAWKLKTWGEVLFFRELRRCKYNKTSIARGRIGKCYRCFSLYSLPWPPFRYLSC